MSASGRRGYAIRWVPRRAAHVLLGGAVIGAVLLAVQTMGEDLATTAFVIRNSAGLMGLVAVGATVWGAQYVRVDAADHLVSRTRSSLLLRWVCRRRWRVGCCCRPARRRAPGRPWSSRSSAPRPTPSRDRDGSRSWPPDRATGLQSPGPARPRDSGRTTGVIVLGPLSHGPSTERFVQHHPNREQPCEPE